MLRTAVRARTAAAAATGLAALRAAVERFCDDMDARSIAPPEAAVLADGVDAVIGRLRAVQAAVEVPAADRPGPRRVADRRPAWARAPWPGRDPAPASPPRPWPDPVDIQVTVLVDGLALRRGWAAPGERCEIPGVGPVAVEWVRRVLPDSVATAVIHDTVDVRAYCSLTGHVPDALRIGLAARDRSCVVPGCSRRVRLEVDHRHPPAEGGPTTWDDLVRLCPLHHAQKAHDGARLERSGTHWLWWPPPAADPPEPTADDGSPTRGSAADPAAEAAEATDSRAGPDDADVPWRALVGLHLHPWDLDAHPPEPRPGRAATDRR